MRIVLPMNGGRSVQFIFSASQVTSADNCRRLHWYQSVAKVKVLSTAANLAFGKCIDESTRNYLRALALDRPLPDPVADFERLWQEARNRQPLKYAATHTPEMLQQSGIDLMKALPTAWDRTGFQVAIDKNGTPLLDLPLQIHVGRRNGIEIDLRGVIDLVVYTEKAELAVLDVKSSALAHTPLYTARSDQLTSYQLLIQVHGPKLALPALARLGFWDLLKRRSTSKFEAPVMGGLRSVIDIREFTEKLFWLAEDIARRRFPRSSRMQFNTPCELCDFSAHCVYGRKDGLRFPPGFKTLAA